jgi:hypothetical protein
MSTVISSAVAHEASTVAMDVVWRFVGATFRCCFRRSARALNTDVRARESTLV